MGGLFKLVSNILTSCEQLANPKHQIPKIELRHILLKFGIGELELSQLVRPPCKKSWYSFSLSQFPSAASCACSAQVPGSCMR